MLKWSGYVLNMKHILTLLALFALAGCAGAIDTPQACAFVQEAEIPVSLQNNIAVIEVKINGQPARLILDTGSNMTALTEAAAERLGVPRDSTIHMVTRGVGRMASSYAGNIGRLEMAQARRTNMMAVIVRETVFPGRDVDGLLGADVLNDFDIDLDFPHQMFRVYKSRNCPSGHPEWAEPAVRLTRLAGGQSQPANFFMATLDGMQLNALVDTGASRTTVERKNVLALGVTAEQLAADRQGTSQGIAAGLVTTSLHRFSKLVVADETISRPYLAVTPLVEAPGFAHQMLLGVDYLKEHRVWLSYASYAAYTARPATATSPTP